MLDADNKEVAVAEGASWRDGVLVEGGAGVDHKELTFLMG
jgi:hypothetical protein